MMQRGDSVCTTYTKSVASCELSAIRNFGNMSIFLFVIRGYGTKVGNKSNIFLYLVMFFFCRSLLSVFSPFFGKGLLGGNQVNAGNIP